MQFFPYTWSSIDTDDIQEIRAYGIDENNQSVCLRILDFNPYVYVQLPDTWDKTNATLMCAEIDDMMGQMKPTRKVYTHKYNLYYANVSNTKKRKTTPYIFLSFKRDLHRKIFCNKMKKPFFIDGRKRVLKVHEQKASVFLQYVSYCEIKTAGWLEYKASSILDSKDRVTICKKEYLVNWKDVKTSDKEREPANPMIMSFDIEVNSTDKGSMPDFTKFGDKVFQISCVYGYQNSGITTSVLLTLGSVGDSKCDFEVQEFESEAALFCGFVDLVKKTDTHVLIGYNIFGFDLPYMIGRSKFLRVYNELMSIGMNVDSEAREKEIKWSSSAYKNQNFVYIEAQGRLFIDLLPLVKRDYKLSNYKLDTVAQVELQKEKDPLSVMDIFRCYRDGVEGGNSDLVAYVGKYCVKDSELVLDLFDHFLYWTGLTEMASISNVAISSLYLQGQQVKVYSQIYQYCLHNNIVVQGDMYKSAASEGYQGAFVFDPVPGLYQQILPFDFCSLYPSVIIANNIDYSTFVTDPNIPDAWCNVIEFSNHSGCEHDTVVHKTKPKYILCGHHRLRFLKEPVGVLPQIAMNLIEARKNTRSLMKNLDKNDPMRHVLDKRQLAYKIGCNSLYGACGVREGYLPFMPAAMATTAMGRQYIEKVAKVITEEYKGDVIYGDSVTEDTPILVRLDGIVMWKTIDDLPRHEWTIHRGQKEMATPITGLEVWTEKGWTYVRNIIRHYTSKPIYRVQTHVGAVDVTEDHGLLDPSGNKISPKEISIGSNLMTADLCFLNECGIYNPLAFVEGLFMADGSCDQSWSIYSSDISVLEKCISLLSDIYSEVVFIIIDTISGFQLVADHSNQDFISQWRHRFYDLRNNKIVPRDILTASKRTRETFFDGYCNSSSFTMKGKIGTAGLYHIASSLGYSCVISAIDDDIYTITTTTTTLTTPSKSSDEVKKITLLGSTPRYVYDLETESHHFQAGVGKLIVHNTDSAYINFPHLKEAPSEKVWDHAVQVADEISDLFPKPMKLEFEAKIYPQFLTLTKKRYMSSTCGRDGIVALVDNKPKISDKGVLLSRRDNSGVIRIIYSQTVSHIFQYTPLDDILYNILLQMNRICSHSFSLEEYSLTKSVGSINNFILNPNSDGLTAQMGSYKVKLLSDDPEKRSEQLLKKGASNERDYYLLQTPAVVQLVERMKQRGEQVLAGTRVEYIVTRHGGFKALQGEKIESLEYARRHPEFCRPETMYYIKQLVQPMDELLRIVFKVEGFVKFQFKLRQTLQKCHDDLLELFTPRLVFQDSGSSSDITNYFSRKE